MTPPRSRLFASSMRMAPVLRRCACRGKGGDCQERRERGGLRRSASAPSAQANAYAVGRDVVFGAGKYAPGSAEGRRLIAHELAHVVQQSGGGEAACTSSLEVGAPDAAEEREADSVANSLPTPEGRFSPPRLRSAPKIRRDLDPGEVMRTGTLAAGMVSQADSPAPGPADAVALVMLAGTALLAGSPSSSMRLAGRRRWRPWDRHRPATRPPAAETRAGEGDRGGRARPEDRGPGRCVDAHDGQPGRDRRSHLRGG